MTISQLKGILTTILLSQFFWNVLAAAGQPTWHVSPPTPLDCPGTITHATIAVSPNATLTAAIQTLEQPNRLHMISLKGNPTELDHTTGQQSVKCQQVGMIETPAGDPVLECMFAPQSAGTSTRHFHCMVCVPALLSLCKRCSQHPCAYCGGHAGCKQVSRLPIGTKCSYIIHVFTMTIKLDADRVFDIPYARGNSHHSCDYHCQQAGCRESSSCNLCFRIMHVCE